MGRPLPPWGVSIESLIQLEFYMAINGFSKKNYLFIFLHFQTFSIHNFPIFLSFFYDRKANLSISLSRLHQKLPVNGNKKRKFFNFIREEEKNSLCKTFQSIYRIGYWWGRDFLLLWSWNWLCVCVCMFGNHRKEQIGIYWRRRSFDYIYTLTFIPANDEKKNTELRKL